MADQKTEEAISKLMMDKGLTYDRAYKEVTGKDYVFPKVTKPEDIKPLPPVEKEKPVDTTPVKIEPEEEKEDTSPENNRKFAVRFEGKVQGVGCRMTCQSTAADLGLKGWAFNTEDGAVELELIGNKEKVDEFIKSMQRTHKIYRYTLHEIK